MCQRQILACTTLANSLSFLFVCLFLFCIFNDSSCVLSTFESLSPGFLYDPALVVLVTITDNGNNLVAKAIFRNAGTRSMASERPLAVDFNDFHSIQRISDAISSRFASGGAFSSREITVFTGSNCSG